MDCAVVFTPQADEEFAALQVDVAIAINDFLNQLAANPSALGKPPYFPFRPGGLLAEFQHELPGQTAYVRIFFHFGKGENTLVITGFVVQFVSD